LGYERDHLENFLIPSDINPSDIVSNFGFRVCEFSARAVIVAADFTMSTRKTAIVTGAGSGVGQAVALELAKQNWNVAIIGRRESALNETVELAGAELAEQFLVCPCNVGNSDEVEAMGKAVLEKWGSVQALVNSAGTNTKKRSFAELSNEDYREIIDVNLNGAFYCAQAVLPSMREQKSGTIVNIVSEAGLWANQKSGPAYICAKFGQSGLSKAINAEERPNGIRACAIYPGDINTPLLDKRPNPPAMELRPGMLQAADLAACVMLTINLPPNAVAEEILLRPA
jgi:NAD(P)-dependent dehydrogenase (short-subunit alcohol dehydrogenase family)